MSSELLAILEKESAAEIERILAEGRERAQQITAEARRQAAEHLQAARARAESERRTALARAASSAQVRAAALVLQAKDRALAEVFSRAEEELRRIRQDRARYAAALRALLREAAAGMSGRLVVEVHPDDRELARQLVKELGIDAEVAAAPDVSGGVRVATLDRRFVVENTLSSRIERIKPVLASEVARVLWGR
ncbi:MAG: V-type ATP synthase subunit E [Armatimonadota bacterium]|nr:V-type ATP synthase subunit E [Armatimonadota bacterium]MDR7451484.1 V-type ATP synthase subunit E [Armatimonadota bacterium]MDR7467451.1 V-type ATP synthase subunit E [Armatimonadota bacterium]MDR7494325.1 V-type ATP synthase subunit E [Armatimonadota bacterium]MDR7499142.1 V-type ATP synthase subunit E [Armatimonadota bacterium]